MPAPRAPASPEAGHAARGCACTPRRIVKISRTPMNARLFPRAPLNPTVFARSARSLTLAALALADFTLLAATAARADDYLFCYFTGNGDGLHLAASTDGLKWDVLNGGKTYLTPKLGKDHLMRDPCLLLGPDGTFHLVWTTGWNDNGIGHATSKDLVIWSEQQDIPVMASEPTVRNSWAPEVVYDETKADYLIFWSSTIPGKFPETQVSGDSGYNHRTYCTTTKDFVTFTPTRLFFEPGFNVIDTTMLRANGKFYLVVKDETILPAPKKNLRLASSDHLEGPYGDVTAPFTPPGVWAEGPTAIKIGGDYIVYYDMYRDKKYGAMRSHDLKTWENISAQLAFPPGTPRHGTVLAVPHAIVASLRAAPPAAAK